jgi:hypothetical protein
MRRQDQYAGELDGLVALHLCFVWFASACAGAIDEISAAATKPDNAINGAHFVMGVLTDCFASAIG